MELSGLHNVKILWLRNFTDEDGNEYSVHARLTLFIMQYAVSYFGRPQLCPYEASGQFYIICARTAPSNTFFTIQWDSHFNKKLHVDYYKRFFYPFASGIKRLCSKINDDSYSVSCFSLHMWKKKNIIYRKYNSLTKSNAYSCLIIS